jgi:hypothetical protein
MAAHGDMSRRDEGDIEICPRTIDLWGSLFIDSHIVACQVFFTTPPARQAQPKGYDPATLPVG